MISCKKATEFISLSMDQPLGIRDSVALRTHLLVCSLCRNFQKNLISLRKIFLNAEPPKDDGPPEGARERLKALLRKNAGK